MSYVKSDNKGSRRSINFIDVSNIALRQQIEADFDSLLNETDRDAHLKIVRDIPRYLVNYTLNDNVKKRILFMMIDAMQHTDDRCSHVLSSQLVQHVGNLPGRSQVQVVKRIMDAGCRENSQEQTLLLMDTATHLLNDLTHIDDDRDAAVLRNSAINMLKPEIGGYTKQADMLIAAVRKTKVDQNDTDITGGICTRAQAKMEAFQKVSKEVAKDIRDDNARVVKRKAHEHRLLNMEYKPKAVPEYKELSRDLVDKDLALDTLIVCLKSYASGHEYRYA